MKRRLILAAATLSIPCCLSSCGTPLEQSPFGQSLKAIGYGALQGAHTAAWSELGKYQPVQPAQTPTAKEAQNVQP